MKQVKRSILCTLAFGILLSIMICNPREVRAAAGLWYFSAEYCKTLLLEKGMKYDLEDGQKNLSSWSSDNPKVVKVSKKGVVTAVKTGKAVISVKEGKKKIKFSINVMDNLSKNEYLKKNLCKKWKYNKGYWDEERQKYTTKAIYVTVSKKNLEKGLQEMLRLENEKDVTYKYGKILAIEKRPNDCFSVYFEALMNTDKKKEVKGLCVASGGPCGDTDEIEMILQVPDLIYEDYFGKYKYKNNNFAYGGGLYWYAEK